MPTFGNWMGGEGQPDAIAEIIGYKSVSTGTITRGTGPVAGKTIRLETLAGQKQVQATNGQVFIIDAFALGELGTDLRPGDRFTVVAPNTASQTFEVVMMAPGHIDCEQYYLVLRR